MRRDLRLKDACFFMTGVFNLRQEALLKVGYKFILELSLYTTLYFLPSTSYLLPSFPLLLLGSCLDQHFCDSGEFVAESIAKCGFAFGTFDIRIGGCLEQNRHHRAMPQRGG